MVHVVDTFTKKILSANFHFWDWLCIPLPQVLEQVFKTPEQWIPENIASVLLLCGPTIAKEFLLYQV